MTRHTIANTANMSNKAPSFAVVGHPNKGKSSLVATLSQDQSITIAATSGTTVHNREFPMVVDGQTLYRLIDTPGFQRARGTLEWLKNNCKEARHRPQAVAEFVAQHRLHERYHSECQLLDPILAGAGIIYVVDGAKPFADEYYTEMEILSWCGQPSMALINQIGELRYEKEWREALQQNFKIVRTFNAQDASFTQQINLLKGFRELQENWRETLNNAVAILEKDRQQRLLEGCSQIADFVAEALSYRVSATIDASDDEQAQEQLRMRLFNDLNEQEANCRQRIENLFNFAALQRHEDDIDLANWSLFSEQTWSVFGLSSQQMLVLSTIGGAAAGGLIDAASGGASMLLGTGVGGLLGGLASFWGQDVLQILKLDSYISEQHRHVGPIKQIQFPYVLLSRAALHLKSILQRTHAKRDALQLNTNADHPDNFIARLSHTRRGQYELVLRKLRKNDDDQARQTLCDYLAEDLPDYIYKSNS